MLHKIYESKICAIKQNRVVSDKPPLNIAELHLKEFKNLAGKMIMDKLIIIYGKKSTMKTAQQRTSLFSRTSSLAMIGFSALAMVMASPVFAKQPDSNSAPVTQEVKDTITPARDIDFPGTMTLEIDATDIERRIYQVKQTITVPEEARASGRFTLLFPEWLPGNHAPRGEIEKIAGLFFSANGKNLTWERDNLDVYAFHVTVGENTKEITAEFQFVAPTKSSQGRIVVTDDMMNLRWHNMSLYPAGYYTRNIPVNAIVTWPNGWTDASAMRAKSRNGDRVSYETVDYETLVDSPVFAGKNFRQWDLGDNVMLNVVADEEGDLDASETQIEHHRRLVREAINLFGMPHFDRYDFLLSLTSKMGGIGLEHHRSSENGVNRAYFTGWNKGPGRRNLLPHEMVHSWNGKYRRPEGIWAPDFRRPSRNDLLWVYEGQTQFWGYVLGARSGLFTKEETLGAMASIASTLNERSGRKWRALRDTTLDPVIASRKPKAWIDWQRPEDYYNEGMLIWLEADGIIRRESNGKKSMQDFAQAFFGGTPGDWGVKTYQLDDVIATLNTIQPYDWATFMQQRVYEPGHGAPLNGFELGGYRLDYQDKPNAYEAASEASNGSLDLSSSLGMSIAKSGAISSVNWEGLAFQMKLTNRDKIVAVNDRDYSASRMKEAIKEAQNTKQPFTISVKRGDSYMEKTISYYDGLRYPHLVKTGSGQTGLDALLAPQTK